MDPTKAGEYQKLRHAIDSDLKPPQVNEKMDPMGGVGGGRQGSYQESVHFLFVVENLPGCGTYGCGVHFKCRLDRVERPTRGQMVCIDRTNSV